MATIQYLIKFFKEEAYANRFMAGELYLNTLSHFREMENERDDGRPDSAEGIATWWQPDDIIVRLSAPGIGETEITKKDLAAPVSTSFTYHDGVNVFCSYAVYLTGFQFTDHKIQCSENQAEEIRRQWRIDQRCLKFGRFAVVTPAGPFMSKLRASLMREGRKFEHKLVRYYDETTFHGAFPVAEIPFWKQKRFSYQREFRVCVYPKLIQNLAFTINIGDISDICRKEDAARLNDLLALKSEPALAT